MENSIMNSRQSQQHQPTILPAHIHDDKNGLNYTLHGDYYFPDITFPKPDPRPIGKWGRMHEQYLREHRPVLYNQLVMQGKLSTHLADLDEQARARLERIIRQMQAGEGVDEKLKARDQLLWVGQIRKL